MFLGPAEQVGFVSIPHFILITQTIFLHPSHLMLKQSKGYLCKQQLSCSSQLNIWDVGGQKSLRSYWRNYFEATDAMIWVVDSADTWRMEDCKAELHNLLKEERLAGATLLILANKQDQTSALSGRQIEEVSKALLWMLFTVIFKTTIHPFNAIYFLHYAVWVSSA